MEGWRDGKVGFAAYCIQIQIRKFSAKRLPHTETSPNTDS